MRPCNAPRRRLPRGKAKRAPRIASIQTLAVASTGALYFAAPYTLQRLCDWQDAALLSAYVGEAKPQMCRERLMVRGATDLQRKAEFLVAASAKDARPRRSRNVKKPLR